MLINQPTTKIPYSQLASAKLLILHLPVESRANLGETSVSFFVLYCLGLKLPSGRVEKYGDLRSGKIAFRL